ncbi:MAG: PH domain-containing protein [Acidimicrobiales bacterium]|jgi:hypothetical protein
MLNVIGARHGTGTPDIEIRTPRSGRLVHGGILVAGGLVATAVTIALAGRGTYWAAGAAVALVMWIAYYYRLLSLAVLVRGDHLEVRNLFATHHLERSRIEAVALGESSVAKSPNQTVVLDLVSGERLALDACARTLQSNRAARNVEELQQRLEVWWQHSADTGLGTRRQDSETGSPLTS